MNRRVVTAVAVAVSLLGTVGPAAASASNGRDGAIAPRPHARAAGHRAADSLPQVASGHRPGPALLYAKPAVSPQLRNRGVWKAPPTLVSGTEAYRDGEWMYQDYLYDDHGALGALDPTTPWSETDFLFSPVAGTFTYPTARRYADNAADLVEFRTKPLPSSTAFRVTLNSLTDPSLVGFTIALGTSATPQEWPADADVTSPAAYFVTVHGHTAALTQAGTGRVLGPAPSVTVSTRRRQFTVEVPHAAWNPGRSTVRMSVGVGLWDRAHHHYLLPALGPATASTPGGGGPAPVGLVNVGPRLNEPWPSLAQPTETIADSAAGELVQPFMWREHEQAYELGVLGSVQPFYANVDFAKLAHHVTDNSDIPRFGSTDRIFASHFSFGQGLDPSQVCGRIVPPMQVGARCKGRMVGQLQPYNLYVPAGPTPRNGYGLTLLLHSLSGNYNQYATSHNQSQLAHRGPGSIVVTPAGRGPDGGYAGVAEADTFEVWNTVAHDYPLDPDWTVVSGYSMGGYGTYRLAERWPDLFARGFSVVGEASPASGLPSLRNVPILAWNATADELVPIDSTIENTQEMTADGLRYIEDVFTAADHLTLATNDQYGPGAVWLGTHRVNRNPAHVTYVVDHGEDNASAGMVANHAYWLSGVTPRRAGAPGTIDVRSLGFGVGDPKPSGMRMGAGLLTGGTKAAIPYVEFRQTWGETPKTPKRDALAVAARNISRVVVDVRRARVDCAAAVHVTSDGPVKVVLSGCGRTIRAS
ncbi:MAG TPA: alpha/beta hydrolase-fold protein [Mycobacteriales bacterium]|nr:alpha/beta hydrolase-fold protein [Mycobacteriales bacterium]